MQSYMAYGQTMDRLYTSGAVNLALHGQSQPVDTAVSVIQRTSIDRRLSVTIDNTQQSQQQQQLRHLWHPPLTFQSTPAQFHTHTDWSQTEMSPLDAITCV